MLCLLWAQELWMFYLAAVLFGLFWGGFNTSFMVLISDIFGLRRLGVILGSITVAFTAGSSVGPPFAGFIFDLSGEYDTVFLAGAISLVVASIFLTLVKSNVQTKLP